MAINSISVVGPQREQQKAPEKDQFDKIIQGLQIANGVLGVAGGLKKLSRDDAVARKLQKVDTVDDSGAPVTKFVDPQAGQSFAKPGPDAASVKPQLINTIDDSGKPVQKFVVPKAGEQFGIPEKGNDNDRDFAHKLRTEYKKDTLKPDSFVKKVEKIENILPKDAEKMSGTAQVTLINQFQRLIDDAVVKSDDINMIRSAQSLQEQMTTWVDGIKNGAKIGDEQVEEMRRMAYELVDPELQRLEELTASAAAEASLNKIDPSRVIGTSGDRYDKLRDKISKFREQREETQPMTPQEQAQRELERRRKLREQQQL